MNVWTDFRTKRAKKSHVRKFIGWNSNTIIVTEKWKNVLRPILTSVVMHPNFIHFCSKIGLKMALGSFTSSKHKGEIHLTSLSFKTAKLFIICMNIILFSVLSCSHKILLFLNFWEYLSVNIFEVVLWSHRPHFWDNVTVFENGRNCFVTVPIFFGVSESVW